MPNKQPFYHRAVVLFTATRELTHEEVLAAVRTGLSGTADVIAESTEVEECDAEAGDPHGLI